FLFRSSAVVELYALSLHDALPILIIDSEYTFEEAVSGIDIPQKILNDLVLIEVEYYSFDKKLHRGQLLINKNLKDDIEEIFKIIDRKSTRLNSSHVKISYAVFCLK